MRVFNAYFQFSYLIQFDQTIDTVDFDLNTLSTRLIKLRIKRCTSDNIIGDHRQFNGIAKHTHDLNVIVVTATYQKTTSV